MAATTSAAETTATSAATDGTGTMPTEPFTLSFLGSTGGEYAADYADFDDVMHVFWRLSLDLPRGNVERGLKKSGGMQRRQLRWDFGEEAAIYFESVITDVEDIGEILSSKFSIMTNYSQHCPSEIFVTDDSRAVSPPASQIAPPGSPTRPRDLPA